MMGNSVYDMVGGGVWGMNSLLGLVTWLLVIAFLVAATRYFWKKGDRK